MVAKADPPAGDPPAGDPPAGDPPEGEEKFWTKLTSLMDERIDAGIDRAIEKRTKPGGRTGRTSFPEMLNDLFFGSPAAKKE